MRILVAAAVAFSVLSAPSWAQEQRTYTLTVTEQQLGVIGNALSELPYKVANPLIIQLAAQVQAQNAPKPVEPPKEQPPKTNPPTDE